MHHHLPRPQSCDRFEPYVQLLVEAVPAHPHTLYTPFPAHANTHAPPQSCDRFEHYVQLLVKARAKKGMTPEVAADVLHGGYVGICVWGAQAACHQTP